MSEGLLTGAGGNVCCEGKATAKAKIQSGVVAATGVALTAEEGFADVTSNSSSSVSRETNISSIPLGSSSSRPMMLFVSPTSRAVRWEQD